VRWLFPFLVVVTLVFGASYAAGLLYQAMGPWEGSMVEADGTVTHIQFGAHLPRPEWVPVYPDAWVVQSSKLVSAKFPGGVHSLELGTRASRDEVKRFYTERLTAAGFAVEDLGIAPLNPLTAAYLGIDGTLVGRRPATDDRIDIQIRTPDGLIIPSRLLQIHWRKISEFPIMQPVPPPAPASPADGT
jgi:hypothetical protein